MHLTASLATLSLALFGPVGALVTLNPRSWQPWPNTVSSAVRDNVTTTIYQWLSDIATVNNFVDTVRDTDSSTAISSQAAVTFKAAQNEGTSNTILQEQVTLDASGQAAAQALLAAFNIIGPAINDTIFNPQNLNKNLATVNSERCPSPGKVGAIALEQAVQQAAALAVGIVAPAAPIPNACHNTNARRN